MATQVSDDQLYAVFSSETVKTCASSLGLANLPDDVLTKLAEDVSYRVREIASKSCEFMRFSRRKKLKSADVDRALHWSKVQPINGASESLKFTAFDGVYTADDPTVDLKELALSDFQPLHHSQIKLTSQWHPNDHSHFSKRKKSQDNSQDGSSEKEVDSFEEYYTSIVDCILSDNEDVFIQILDDLRHNPRIGPVAKYLVNFVSRTNLVSHDLHKLPMMLSVIKALLTNRHISLQFYLKPMLKSVLYCVLEPLAASINPLNDHWLVRDYGALLAAQLVYSHATEVDFLLDHVHKSVNDILSDTTRPLCSHYGAVMLAAMLGERCIRTLILPNLADYINGFLLPIMDDLSVDNVHTNSDAQKVFGGCLLCLEKLHYVEKSGGSHFPAIDPALADCFGDALSLRLPLHDFQSGSTRSEPPSSETKSSIPWHRYNLSSSIKNRFSLRPGNKRTWSDYFPSQSPIKRAKSIRIDFGTSRPIKTLLKPDHEPTQSPSDLRLQLVPRIEPKSRCSNNTNVYSLL